MSGLDPFKTLGRTTDEISDMTRKLGRVTELLRGPLGFLVKPFHVVRDGNLLTIEVPPMHYIPIHEDALLKTLAGRLAGSDRRYFNELIRLMDSATQALYSHHREHVLRAFSPFADAAASRTTTLRRGERHGEADLDALELDFLREFMIMMNGANYSMLTGLEWEAALAEAYLITMPVEVVNHGLSDGLVSRLYEDARFRDFKMLLPVGQVSCPINDRVLIFHRGITQLRTRGLFLSDKLDLLFAYSVTWLLRWLAWAVLQLCTCGRYPRRERFMPELDQVAAKLSEGHPSFAVDERVAVGKMRDRLGLGQEEKRKRLEEEGGADAAQHAGRAERMTLERALPSFWAVLGNLFAETEIREPAFKEMCILYRRRDPREMEGTKQSKGAKRSQAQTAATHQALTGEELTPDGGGAADGGGGAESPAGQLRADVEAGGGGEDDLEDHKYEYRRNIFIKSFENVPLADLELVMPDKYIKYDTRTLFTIFLTLGVGIGVGIFTLYRGVRGSSTQSSNQLSASLAFAGALILRAQLSFFALQAKKSRSTQKMMETLFQCARNTQEGVLLSGLRSTESEQHKEDMLVFYTLHRARRALRVADLDELCEHLILALNKGRRVDVNIQKIVDRLVQFGLVAQRGDGDEAVVRAVSLEDAVRTMQHLNTVASTMPEANACLFVKQMLIDDQFIVSDTDITERMLSENNQMVQSGSGWFW